MVKIIIVMNKFENESGVIIFRLKFSLLFRNVNVLTIADSIVLYVWWLFLLWCPMEYILLVLLV